jgi:hypothetical protein
VCSQPNLNVKISLRGTGEKIVTFLRQPTRFKNSNVFMWKGEIVGCKLSQYILDPTRSFGKILGGCTYNYMLCNFKITISRNFNLNKNKSITKCNTAAEADLIIPHGVSVII